MTHWDKVSRWRSFPILISEEDFENGTRLKQNGGWAVPLSLYESFSISIIIPLWGMERRIGEIWNYQKVKKTSDWCEDWLVMNILGRKKHHMMFNNILMISPKYTHYIPRLAMILSIWPSPSLDSVTPPTPESSCGTCRIDADGVFLMRCTLRSKLT